MNVGLFIKDFEFGIKISEKLSEFELSFDFCDTPSDIMDETQLLIIDLDDIDKFDDFESLAALIQSLDLFITVSNTTAHLSGAIGKETWVFIPMII